MRISSFISKRIYSSESDKSSSGPIVRIAIIGMILSTAVLLFTLSIVRGFQSQITQKATYFAPHIRVHHIQEQTGQYAHFFKPDDQLREQILQIPGIRAVYPMVHAPAILEYNGIISGVTALGVDSSFFIRELNSHPLEGLGLSNALTQKFGAKKEDRFSLFFDIQAEKPKSRTLELEAQIHIGISEIDNNTVWVPLTQLQEILNPAPKIFFQKKENKVFRPILSPAKGDLFLDNELWAEGQLHLTREWSTLTWVLNNDTLAKGRIGLDEKGFGTFLGFRPHHEKYLTSLGIFVDDLANMDDIDAQVFNLIPSDLTTSTVKETFPEIFGWLQLLNTNIWVIVSLIAIVGASNGVSTLLVIILEKVPAVGILKGIGTPKSTIRAIFWKIGLKILGISMVLGNLFFLTVALCQNYFGIFQLDETLYFLDQVPMIIEPGIILLVNAGIAITGMLSLYIPTYFINKIQPAKALRYDP